jgi:hypothetical protein
METEPVEIETEPAEIEMTQARTESTIVEEHQQEGISLNLDLVLN